MGTPARFLWGVGTQAKDTPFGDFPLPFPGYAHVYFNDFDHLAEFNGITDTASWDVTATGAGTLALADGDGGLALITNAAADNDAVFFQKKGESFRMEAGKKAWAGIRFKTNDATQSDIIFGLMITDTTPLDVSDGIFFLKADDAAAIVFSVEKDNTASTEAVGTLVSDAWTELGFFYDGREKVYYYLDGVELGWAPVTNLPNDEDLTITFGIQNGAAAAKTMHVDWIFAAKER